MLWALLLWILESVGDMEGPGPSSRKCERCQCKALTHVKKEALDATTTRAERTTLWIERTHHVQCFVMMKEEMGVLEKEVWKDGKLIENKKIERDIF